MGNNLKRITKGIIYKSFSTGMVTLIGFIVSVFIARYFGKDNYAYLILAYTILSFFAIFTNFGICSAVGRFVPLYLEKGKKEDTGFFIKSSVILTSLFTLFFAGLLYLLINPIAKGFFQKPELIPLLEIGVLYLIGSSFLLFVSHLFKAIQRWREESFISVLDSGLYLLGILFLTFLVKGTIKSVLWAHIFASLFTILLGLYILYRKFPELSWEPISFKKFEEKSRQILSFSAPLLFSNFIFYLMMWFDKAMLGIYRSNQELTYYYIAALLIGGFMTLFKVLYTVLSPYLAQVSQSSPEMLREKFVLLFRWFLQICVLICLILYFLSRPLVLSVYGTDYSPTVLIFRIMLLIFILRGVSNPIDMFLVNVFGDTKQILRISLVVVSVNVMMNLVLIPKYGYYGAVTASLAAFILSWGYILIFIKKIRGMIPFSAIFKSVLSLSLVVILNLLFYRLKILNLYLSCALSLVFYIGLLKILNEIKPSDLLLTKKIAEAIISRGK